MQRHVALDDDLAVYGAGQTCCVALVGVDVHGGGVLVAYTDNDITEHDRSAGAGADLDRNDLLVLKAVFLGGLGVKVDVTLCACP